MVQEPDRNLVEAQVMDSQDRMNKYDSTDVFYLLHELFHYAGDGHGAGT